jgi:hypothetical protein
MTWKSYVAVSSATVLAGWLASSPSSNEPASAVVSRPQSPRRDAQPANDIEEQATRLQSRLRAERAYAEPQRNPFRFAAREAAGDDSADRGSIPELPSEPVDLPPSAPAVSVAGIAEEQIDGRVVRTAILSSPLGVLLVREGEEILGYYRVTRIEGEAVELVGLADDMPLRLTLGTPR